MPGYFNESDANRTWTQGARYCAADHRKIAAEQQTRATQRNRKKGRTMLKLTKRGAIRRRLVAEDGSYIGEVWRTKHRPHWCLSLDGVLWGPETNQPASSGFTAAGFARMRDALAAAEKYRHLVKA